MLPPPVQRLIQSLARLPGVGEKTAQRFALHLILDRPALLGQLSDALLAARDGLCACRHCGNVAERATAPGAAGSGTSAAASASAGASAERGQDQAAPDEQTAACTICRDPRRDPHLMCVVARIQDLLAIERSGAMRGRYFVLGRLLSPLDGIGPEDLPLERLRTEIEERAVQELVVATPPSVDGEATALFLAQTFGPALQVTRIASGVPHGGELEFADAVTLGRALSGRRRLE